MGGGGNSDYHTYNESPRLLVCLLGRRPSAETHLGPAVLTEDRLGDDSFSGRLVGFPLVSGRRFARDRSRLVVGSLGWSASVPTHAEGCPPLFMIATERWPTVVSVTSEIRPTLVAIALAAVRRVRVPIAAVGRAILAITTVSRAGFAIAAKGGRPRVTFTQSVRRPRRPIETLARSIRRPVVAVSTVRSAILAV